MTDIDIEYHFIKMPKAQAQGGAQNPAGMASAERLHFISLFRRKLPTNFLRVPLF